MRKLTSEKSYQVVTLILYKFYLSYHGIKHHMNIVSDMDRVCYPIVVKRNNPRYRLLLLDVKKLPVVGTPVHQDS